MDFFWSVPKANVPSFDGPLAELFGAKDGELGFAGGPG